MSDHLPECEWNDETRVNRRCICPALRACEQRAYSLGKAHERERNMVVDHEHRQESYAIGYAAGLDAAREAVDGVMPIAQRVVDDLISLVYEKDEILAAIDALRGES